MANTTTTKRKLYFSALSMIVCVTMLIGATFAWFTDTASTGVNSVQAGTLDVQLVDALTGTDITGDTLEFVKPSGVTEPVLWEPGVTYDLPAVAVKNNGNLALKYKLVITGINGDAKLNEAIDWTIGGLAVDTEYQLLPGAQSDPLTISGHMLETAGNEYQGLSIEGIAITVVATQDTVESDSTDNQYDASAPFPVLDAADFRSAVLAGGDVVLGQDVTIPNALLGSESGYGPSGIAQTNGGTIDGGGNTISAPGATSTWAATIYTKGGTIKNATITGGFRGIFIAGATQDIIVDNVIINPIAYTISCDSGGGKNLIVTNSTLNGWTSYAGTLASASFTDCTFGSNGSYAYMRPYCDTVITNCEFSSGFEVDATPTGDMTFVDCTVGGVTLTPANLTTLLGADAATAIVVNN